MIEKKNFDSFGNEIETCGRPALLNRYCYTGREFDYFGASYETTLYSVGLGHYHNRARTYDHTLGTFLQTDPVWAPNLYVYTGNNPVYKIDPFGKADLYTMGVSVGAGEHVYYEYGIGEEQNGKYGGDYIITGHSQSAEIGIGLRFSFRHIPEKGSIIGSFYGRSKYAGPAGLKPQSILKKMKYLPITITFTEDERGGFTSTLEWGKMGVPSATTGEEFIDEGFGLTIGKYFAKMVWAAKRWASFSLGY